VHTLGAIAIARACEVILIGEYARNERFGFAQALAQYFYFVARLRNV
jgi:hypothetical protein